MKKIRTTNSSEVKQEVEQRKVPGHRIPKKINGRTGSHQTQEDEQRKVPGHLFQGEDQRTHRLAARRRATESTGSSIPRRRSTEAPARIKFKSCFTREGRQAT
jgi:hypothetical protein